ncbi:MAG: 7-cyano-7-deazaguanine synthase QueC [Desulfosalsimonadaceae bacterium]
MEEHAKAVVLVSGGLDSATVLAIAKNKGYRCYALSFDYGQRHRLELEAAEKISENAGCQDHRVIRIDLAGIGGSALTSDREIPKSRPQSGKETDIPDTYVPARNTIFLSCALARAEVISARDIFIGVNAVDYSGYPDCRPEYIRAFEKMANLATRAGVKEGMKTCIHAPLMHLSKAEIIRQGLALGVDYSLTRSCYDPSPQGLACGACDSCRLRKKGFAEAGSEDPIAYVRD